jgi:tetratricopeptide (TPR) repeat protein
MCAPEKAAGGKVWGGMKAISIILALIHLVAIGSARADTMSDCRQSRVPATKLQACGEIIDRPAFDAESKAVAYRIRGTLRASAGAATDAIEDFTHALRLQPGNWSAYAGRARARLVAGNLAAAIADYGEAVKLMPRSASLHIERGHALLSHGDVEAAVADFSSAIALAPNSSAAFNNRGLAYRKKGDLSAAAADYSSAIAINPVYALAYANRGYVLEAQGRKSAAIEDLRRALQLDPAMTAARDALTRLGASRQVLIESDALVRGGEGLVHQHCARCHATGKAGASPYEKAPAFRDIHRRHPLLALREPLTRGIAAPHDQMPRFALSNSQIDMIVAYINSLGGGQ